MAKNMIGNEGALNENAVFDRARRCEMNNLCFISLKDLGNSGVKLIKSLSKNVQLEVWVLPEFAK